MKNELKRFKKIYWDIQLSDSQMENSWQELKKRINTPAKIPYFRFGAVFFSLFFIFLTGVVGITLATPPGSQLYPVRILTDQVIAKVSGQPQITIERRAKDLIEVSKKQPEQVQEASKQYQKSLDDAQKETEQNYKKRDKVNNSLDQQEQKLKRAIEDNPKAEKELKKAMENTNKVKEKLKQNLKK